MIKYIMKRPLLFIGSIFIFTVLHLLTVFIITALMTGWHDVNVIGTLLRIILSALIPFLFLGDNVAFLGLWIYILSALLWAIILTLVTTYSIGKHKDKVQKVERKA